LPEHTLPTWQQSAPFAPNPGHDGPLDFQRTETDYKHSKLTQQLFTELQTTLSREFFGVAVGVNVAVVATPVPHAGLHVREGKPPGIDVSQQLSPFRQTLDPKPLGQHTSLAGATQKISLA
jgi:hypothetical protein